MEPTPLFNHLVLEKVFGNLSLPDLKSCRLVSTVWNVVSTPFVVKLAEIHLEGGRLEEYLASDQITSSLPFDSYVIKIGSILSLNPNLKLLWENVSCLKYLTLHLTTFYARRELQSILNLPNLVKIKVIVMKYWGTCEEDKENVFERKGGPNFNLKCFKLCYLGFDDGDNVDFTFPMEWTEFFRHFPKIRQLSLIGLSPEDISGMLEALQEIQLDGSPSLALKGLEILDESTFPEAPTDAHFSIVGKLNFEFTSLHFELSPLVTADTLNEAIAKHKNSLQSLRLRRYPHPFIAIPISLTVPLNFVTFLEVSNGLVSNLDLLPLFPSLETFHVILRDYRSLPCCELLNNTENPENISHPNVKSVYIEPPLISKSCIKRLAVIFPNLERLRLRVNDEMLQEICLEVKEGPWKYLTDLFITSWDGLTDEGLTGINEQVLKAWGSYSCFEPERQRTMPYIGQISGLRNLTIEMWNDYDNHVNDWSVYYGISELRKLQQVVLIRTGISETAFHSIPVKNKRLVSS